jgi:hypothetical protein
MKQMWLKETKKLIFSVLVLLLAVFFSPDSSNGQNYSSGNFTVENPVIDSGSPTSSSANFGLGQSLSQIAIGKSTSASFQVWSGFQYYFKVNANTLTVTPDDSEVDLSWTAPSTYLGVSVVGYEVGTGTTSGSYTFENVGNVTSFTKSGLINGTPYYFIVKAYASGGSFLVFSNEDTATPVAAVTPSPTPSSGGGFIQGRIYISGTAYPNSAVTVTRDAFIVSNLTADFSGNFSTTINNQPPGTYTYTFYATDADGSKSATIGYERTIQHFVQAGLSGVIVPPTLRSSNSSVKQGESITFTGYTAPNAPVTLTFTGQKNFTQNVTSVGNGNYTYSLATSPLSKGTYYIRANSVVNGQTSNNSYSVMFIVGDVTVVPPPAGQCKRSDLNCDGSVNLVDFSILLYFWDQRDFSRNSRVDIDGDGDADLKDLSIMLYDWTG